MKKIGTHGTIIICFGIVCIAIPISIALSKGIDGAILAGGIATIAALVGGALGFRIKK